MSRILVIEDEEPVRLNILELLQVEGYEAIGAGNGLSGLQTALQMNPNLIVCDVMIPELDGYQVLEHLRKNPQTASIPFIFLSARADKSDLRAGMDLGADDYLTKPFTRDELLHAIRVRLEKKAVEIEKYNEQIKRVKMRADRLKWYDSRTGLPNRFLLEERLNRSLQTRETANPSLALLMIGLDKLGRIDALDSSAGDILFKSTAERIRGCSMIEPETISRIEADQLAVATCLKEDSQLEECVQGILQSFSRPFRVHDQEVLITPSIGIALYPYHGMNSDELIRNARIALMEAPKSAGKVRVFESNLGPALLSQLVLEAGLAVALQRQEFLVYYQPQTDLRTGQIIGSEALIRWKHPKRGMIPPAQFIPLAEETGLILPIGEWIMQAACLQTSLWQHAGHKVRVSVNLSARQFAQKDLIPKLEQILELSDLDPALLDLELTESAFLHDLDSSMKTVQRIKALGIQLSIDDFGTGYSSLTYLCNLPFDRLKIDRSFVMNLTVDSRKAAICRALIEMAHALSMIVVAEGVETKEELDFLQANNCDLVQGYLLSPPIPAKEFEDLVESGSFSVPSK